MRIPIAQMTRDWAAGGSCFAWADDEEGQAKPTASARRPARRKEAETQLEEVGKDLRGMMSWLKK